MVELKDFSSQWAKDIEEAMNNPKITRYLRDGIPQPYTRDDAVDFINTARQSPQSEKIFKMIFKDGEYAGNISVTKKDNIYRKTAEIGYVLKEQYWGQGIAADAVKQVVSLAFAEMDIIRIEAGVLSENAASAKVLLKSGFEFEGTLRNSAFKNGKYYDILMYSIINTGEMRAKLQV